MIKNIPNHVALIPDGNRRWAKEKGLPTYEGHQKGFQALINIGKESRELGIKILTVWAFSTENWKRSSKEVGYLMKLYEIMLEKYLKEALREKIRIIHLGRKDRINHGLKKKIIAIEEKTKKFDKFYLCIALDYGGRDEILRAVEQIKNLNDKVFDKFLDTKDLPYPNPDLIIRTGGESRLSGFLLWQSQCSELIFVKKYLPDFKPEDFEGCINSFVKRQRRFGK